MRRPGRLGLVTRRVAGVFVTLALLAGTIAAVSLTTSPARAWDPACAVGGGEAANVGPEGQNVGSSFWVPFFPREDVEAPDNPRSEMGRKLEEGYHKVPSRYTLWEVAGTRGLLWSYAPRVPNDDVNADNFDRDNSDNNFQDACSPVDASAGYLAQLMFEPSRFIGGLTIGLKQVATAEGPFAQFYERQSELLEVLQRSVFQPAVALAVIAAGVWVMTRFRRQDDQRETYAGIIWSAVIVVGVSAVLMGSNQADLTRFIDSRTSQFTQGALNAVAGVTQQGDNRREGPCYIWDRDAYNEGARNSSCMMYEMLLYNPWALGQFGTTDPVTVEDLCYDREAIDAVECEPDGNTSQDGCIFSPYRCAYSDRPADGDGNKTQINLAVQQIIAQAQTRNETIEGARESPEDDGEYTAYERMWRNVYYATAHQHPENYMMWKGSEPTSRMATAISTGVVNLIMLLAVGLIALLTIFWHGVMFVAWILLPVVGAVAAFPPARRIFVGYLGIMVQAVFLRAVMGLILVLLLSIMNAINISHSNTGLKIILMIIAAAAMWKLLSSLRTGQTAPSVVREAQGQGTLPSDQQMTTAAGQTARRSSRIAVGSAAGGVRGTRVGYTSSSRQGWGRMVDTIRGGRRGTVSGGANATRTGRQAQWSSEMGEQAARKGSQRDELLRQQKEKAKRGGEDDV